MNLPDAIERLRDIRHSLLNEAEFWGDFDTDQTELASSAAVARRKDALALAVCLEALAEQAHDGSAILREVNPRAYATLEACVESLAAYAHGGEWAPPKELELLEALTEAPIDTTKSAPPLTPERS